MSTKKCDKPVAQQNAPRRGPLTPEATIPSMTAMEYLHKINLKLEELERGLVGSRLTTTSSVSSTRQSPPSNGSVAMSPQPVSRSTRPPATSPRRQGVFDGHDPLRHRHH